MARTFSQNIVTRKAARTFAGTLPGKRHDTSIAPV